MNKILIKNASLDGKSKDILIVDKLIAKIDNQINEPQATLIDAKNLAALPAFYNMHTHSAMTILRGFADDMPLMPWLQEKIWPIEAKMTEEDVYWGTKFACLEMIKSGTVLANDMYWHWKGEARAASEMGLRMINGMTLIDSCDDKNLPKIQKDVEAVLEISHNYGDLVQFCLAPHAIYTVSEKTLIWTAEFARKYGLKLQIHVAETQEEVINCQNKYGLSPVQFLDKIGFLADDVVTAHMIWLDDKDFEIIKKRKIAVAHCPVSNMKLASGIFKFDKFIDNDIPVCIATDGVSSNNNLDLFEEMKFAALLPKVAFSDPEIANADSIYKATTLNPANALKMPAGEIKPGNLADLILVDLNNINLTPNHNLISNLVYSAHSDCVHTTICNGKILMQDRQIEGEEEIIKQFNNSVSSLLSR